MTTGRTQEKSEQLKDEGRHLTETTKEKGAEIGEQAKREAGHMMDDVKDRTRRQADEQAQRAAGALRGVAGQLSSMADSTHEKGMLVDVARQGADRVERLADQLEQDGVQGVIEDIERFARRRPGMFIAAGVGVGFVLGRIIKAGAEVMQENGQDRLAHSDSMYDIRDEPRISPTPATEPIGTPAATGSVGDQRIRP